MASVENPKKLEPGYTEGPFKCIYLRINDPHGQAVRIMQARTVGLIVLLLGNGSITGERISVKYERDVSPSYRKLTYVWRHRHRHHPSP